ncbi:MAG TPA: hypothetical protein VLZ07_09700, partial [Syntrophales bacterium]|nr:hypothetical protein [Syntrophales bacterium]
PHTKAQAIDVGKKAAELETFLNDLAVKMPKGSLPASEVYAMSRAEMAWGRDPFFEKKSFREWERRKEGAKTGFGLSQKVSFSYSGYLRLKDKNMAIINGLEYEDGDPLEVEGYVLKKIYPGKVIIVNQKSGAKFEVPLQE